MSAFFSHYQEIYGTRWSTLLQGLLAPAPKVSRACFGGYASYVMDPASIRAAKALGVQPGDRVLDMCAAPGGKSLILAESLAGKGVLIANELSSTRRRRLKEVIDTHVPEEQRDLITITGFDGNLFGLKRAGEFDRVLLDAPCSSEAHLLAEDPDMKDWRESRTRQLAMRQYSLLCSALLALKPGGALVYSTCSISPLENDGVIGRLLERKADQVMLDPDAADLPDLEKTESGFQIFPDRSGGAGPIYLSRLVKLTRST
ncbi:MAG: RsmB/NOP family class I SAM-dependent RNA methyltransferase [Proteobacteria bacterium]|nr:RsmB/NOP family class I SAM-dependent RNA methyltransferase [Pseudomonadota bacterium]